VARLVDPGLTIAVTYLLFIVVLLWRPTGLFGRPAGEARLRPRARRRARRAARLRAESRERLPARARHQPALLTVLATAWALFSGPTHYISLATVAFFGIGAYTVAVLAKAAVARGARGRGLIGIAVALVVGLSTLRLSGIYFVIFTFGLSELIRQLVSWYEINVQPLGRPLHLPQHHDRADLLAAPRTHGARVLVGWLIGRSRLGLALRVIGNDEVVARHCGIRYDGRQARDVCAQRAVHEPDRRRDGAALDLHRPGDRVLAAALVRGRDHGAAWRRRLAVRAACSAPCRWCCCSRC
jgi:ABC-type branched-subunit amino acid transport system permease subunit